MKKLILLFLVISFNVNAQIKFSSSNNSQFSSESVLIEFDDSAENSKGLILPMVISKDPLSVDGTLLYDAEDFKFKVKQDGQWIDMNEVKPNWRPVLELTNMRDVVGAGVTISDETITNENSVGVLVLSSTNKAMVLPKIKSPDIKVVNPYVGMICYDTDSEMLAMFDGAVWNYWK